MGSAHLSDDTKEKIRSMMRQIGELESVGDSCFNLARIMRRKREHKVWFDDSINVGILQMYELVDEALSQMNRALSGHREEFNIGTSYDIEHQINNLRNELKDRNIANLDKNLYSYELGTVLNDLIGECEKAGDYIINVVQARMGEE